MALQANTAAVPQGVAVVRSHPTSSGWLAIAHEVEPTALAWGLVVDAICVTAS